MLIHKKKKKCTSGPDNTIVLLLSMFTDTSYAFKLVLSPGSHTFNVTTAKNNDKHNNNPL